MKEKFPQYFPEITYFANYWLVSINFNENLAIDVIFQGAVKKPILHYFLALQRLIKERKFWDEIGNGAWE